MQSLLEKTYRDNKQALFTLALAITGCESSAEDSLHHAFSKLGEQELSRVDLVPYVFRAVKNAAVDYRRRLSRQGKYNESVFNGYIPPPQSEFNSPEKNTLTAERDQILRAAIDELDEIPKQVVLLKSFSDLTYGHIGVVLEISEKTAATHYRRSLVKLAHKLRGQL